MSQPVYPDSGQPPWQAPDPYGQPANPYPPQPGYPGGGYEEPTTPAGGQQYEFQQYGQQQYGPPYDQPYDPYAGGQPSAPPYGYAEPYPAGAPVTSYPSPPYAQPFPPAPPPKKSNTGLVVGVVILALVILVGGGVTAAVLISKAGDDSGGGGGTSGSATTAVEGFLRGLAAKNATEVSKWTCDARKGIEETGVQALIDQEKSVGKITITWSNLKETSKSSSEAEVTADVLITVAGGNATQHWTFRVIDESGWKVCGGTFK